MVAATHAAPITQTFVGNDGMLNVASRNGFCEVSVNSVAHGVTPIAGIEVPPGPAVVTCKSAERELTRHIVIDPGKRVRVSFDLDRGTAESTATKDWGF
jgi:hypothetical protein